MVLGHICAVFSVGHLDIVYLSEQNGVPNDCVTTQWQN